MTKYLKTGDPSIAPDQVLLPLPGVAKTVHVPLIRHAAPLELNTKDNATWQIPGPTEYGQTAVYIPLECFSHAQHAELACCYINTATSGTNQLGLVFGAAPVASESTVTPIASSVTTLANSSSYPQTFVTTVYMSDCGETGVWVQTALNLASFNTGPKVFSLDLIFYF